MRRLSLSLAAALAASLITALAGHGAAVASSKAPARTAPGSIGDFNGDGFADLALFEVGQAYRGDAPEDQFIAASGVRAGAAPLTGAGRHWSRTAEEASLFDAKADVVALKLARPGCHS